MELRDLCGRQDEGVNVVMVRGINDPILMMEYLQENLHLPEPDKTECINEIMRERGW